MSLVRSNFEYVAGFVLSVWLIKNSGLAVGLIALQLLVFKLKKGCVNVAEILS